MPPIGAGQRYLLDGQYNMTIIEQFQFLTKGRHVVTVTDGQESDEGDLHASKCSQSIPSGITDVNTGAVSSHADENKDMERNQVGDENISTPS
jgi:hypothetical protein